MSKGVVTYEAECYTCEAGTLFTEDLSQTPEHIGGYDMVWADCTVCEFGVKFYGSNA